MRFFNGFKEKFSKLITVVLAITLILSGCSNLNQVENKEKSNQKITEVENKANEEIKTKKIVDMMGREIIVPNEVKKIFPAFFIANLAVYTIDPTLLVGKTFDPIKGSEKFLTKEYLNLESVGTYMHGNDANEEKIIELKPDIIIYMGILNQELKEKADETQERLKIPVILVDASLEKTSESYRFLGDLLDRKEKAEELAKYSQETIDEARRISKEIKEDEKKTVFCALDGGRSTDPSGSIHAEIIDLVGGKIAAQLDANSGYKRTEVSMEQILGWSPDVIITHKTGSVGEKSESFFEEVFKKPEWESIKGVMEKEVYEIPNIPFNWYDMPPSVNRLIGIKWLGNLLYPDKFNLDIKKETKEFYKKFYHVDLTDDDLDEILKNCIKKD